MTHPLGSTKHISLQVRDQEGEVSMLRLAAAESDASGTLSILRPTGEVSWQFGLSHLKKDRGGTQLSCYVSGAAATLSLERDKNPPELQVVASLIFPIFEAAYQIELPEQERLMAWVNDLRIGIITSS